MQGRLAEAPNNDDLDWFPDENWKEEFDLAKRAWVWLYRTSFGPRSY